MTTDPYKAPICESCGQKYFGDGEYVAWFHPFCIGPGGRAGVVLKRYGEALNQLRHYMMIEPTAYASWIAIIDAALAAPSEGSDG